MLTQLEDAYGGRPALAETLSANADPRAVRLATLLADPAQAGKSLLDACCDADIAPSTVMTLLRDGAVMRAVASAHLQLQDRLPAIVDVIADRAEGGLVKCRCTIGGLKDPLDDCSLCRGTGQVPQSGSLPHQQLIFDVLGLTSKSSGVSVNVQQQTAVVTTPTSVFDAFVKSGSTTTITRGGVVRPPAAITS